MRNDLMNPPPLSQLTSTQKRRGRIVEFVSSFLLVTFAFYGGLALLDVDQSKLAMLATGTLVSAALNAYGYWLKYGRRAKGTGETSQN